MSGLLGIQPIESRTGGSAGEGAPDRGWMKTAFMHAARFQVLHQGPDLIPDNVCGERIKTARPEWPAFGQDGRGQDGTWMAVHADVVIVEYVSRRAVDQCRIGRREVASRGNFGCAIVCRGGGRNPRDELWRLFARTGNHRSNAVEHADARSEQTALRDRVRTNVGNEFGKTGGERFHDFSHSPELRPRPAGPLKPNLIEAEAQAGKPIARCSILSA